MDTAWHLLGDLRRVVPAPWSEVLLIATSFVCGAIVGAEREWHDKPAGLRTLALICVGSATFTVISVSAPMNGEPARIAAQIVTGVGFLGAGAILRDRFGITGLTTAATVWVTAALGIVAGAGYAVPALGLSLLVLGTLSVVGRAEALLAGRCTWHAVRVLYDAANGKGRVRVQRVLDATNAPVRVGTEGDGPGGLRALPLTYCSRHREHRLVLSELAEVDGVHGFDPAPDGLPVTASRRA